MKRKKKMGHPLRDWKLLVLALELSSLHTESVYRGGVKRKEIQLARSVFRVKKSEAQLKRPGRSGNSSQQRNFVGGGGVAAPPLSSPGSSSSVPSLSTNRSFKKFSNGQGGQSRMGGASLNSESNVAVSNVRIMQNGAHAQSQLHDAPASGAAERIDSSVSKSSRALPKAPSSQPGPGSGPPSESATPVTPSKGDVSKAFPLQFGSISPGFMNGMQIPARTSSAPPNLDEQKRDQVMSQNQGDENEYMEEDHAMADVYDDVDEEFQVRGMGSMESDDDEYDHMDNKITDTSSAQARGGKDIQGIPWERLNVTRKKYRQTRLEQYKNYESVPQSGEESEKKPKVNMIITDYCMPEMTGFDLLKRVKFQKRTAPNQTWLLLQIQYINSSLKLTLT